MAKQQSTDQKVEIMRKRRDEKVHQHLSQYAPVWLIREEALVDKDALQFEVLFFHPKYQWVNRRYFYDSYQNIVYQKGQVLVDEEETYDIQAQDPFINADTMNTVNSYGG